MLNIKQHIEQFHLIFLEQLGRKIDKRMYTLKGGCNLRFYFKSFRYSEDIDFDTQIISQNTLKKNVSNILESQSIKNILQTHEIIITNISEPKQTTTTQRWKITFDVAKLSAKAHTKIEFSRRENYGTSVFEAIDSSITSTYRLPPIFLSHYDSNSMLLQKIAALAGRNITQARDIFDLYLLTGKTSAPDLKKSLPLAQQNLLKKQIVAAIENMHNIKYGDFLSQVVSYLTTEHQKSYSSKEIWQQVVNNVEQTLLENQNAIK
jgi:predicted nucleotidyltransferase component of viral defense system